MDALRACRLVPSLDSETDVLLKLYFLLFPAFLDGYRPHVVPRRCEVQLREQGLSQMEFGNEGGEGGRAFPSATWERGR
ncbi:MAG: hypothetical protein BWY09_02310 [Candidatus Hydrogenedentes bacterium ADurb.Bin179]|nr:MAG: hypothetical protein BWY09_02310 [Candidatus Hydrogenedentes bacterium ADurb.Bin179]